MLIFIASAFAQDRFSFAEMYVGADARLQLGTLYSETAAGEAASHPWWSAGPRLWIGGLHFWGHADFYVAFGIPPNISDVTPDAGLDVQRLSQSVETGARVYPWALRPGTVRPWAGVAWTPADYAQADPELGAGPWVGVQAAQLGAGVSARLGAHTVEVGGGYLPLRVDYPVSTERTETATASVLSASVAYKLNFDTTLSTRELVASGAVAADQQALDEAGALSTWSIAAGGSSAFTLGPDNTEIPWAGNPSAAIFADVAAGYYLHRPDAALRASWRRIPQGSSGYGSTRQWRRQAVSVEAFKMLFDYQGFVPFVGPGLGVNHLTYAEDGQETTGIKLSPELVFGWDIRPTETQRFILRTNLRYAPLLQLDTPGATFRHLEFNFIQLVLYPKRFGV